MDPNSEEADQARERLMAERARVQNALDQARQEQLDDGPITRSGDAAADTTTLETNIELQRELEAQRSEIDAALKRVDDGTYGIDEVTGEPINPERLEVMPAARTNT